MTAHETSITYGIREQSTQLRMSHDSIRFGIRANAHIVVSAETAAPRADVGHQSRT